MADKGRYTTIFTDAVALIRSDITYWPKLSNCWFPVSTWVEVLTKSNHINASMAHLISETGALLSAATIDHILFDKTGTICGDTQSMSHVVNGMESTETVLAESNSLVQVDEAVVGGPLDMASLRASGWTLDKTMWTIKMFSFDADRRTSSLLVLVQDAQDGMRVCSLVKGAPDGILNLVSSVLDTEQFKETVAQLGQDGYRIIAMGIQDVAQNSTLFELVYPHDVRNNTSIEKVEAMARKRTQTTVHRDAVETVATFQYCGFACFEASVRASSPRRTNNLHMSVTACHH